MKLRNKKTGEVVNVIVYSPFGNYNIRIWNDKDYLDPTCNDEYLGEYKTLADLNEEWEDYKPAEPLIKDEKVCKAVRAWAEAFGVTNVYVYGIGDGKDYIELYAQDNGVTDGRIRMSISTQNGVWIGKEYTIAELCGEEEE